MVDVFWKVGAQSFKLTSLNQCEGESFPVGAELTAACSPRVSRAGISSCPHLISINIVKWNDLAALPHDFTCIKILFPQIWCFYLVLISVFYSQHQVGKKDFRKHFNLRKSEGFCGSVTSNPSKRHRIKHESNRVIDMFKDLSPHCHWFVLHQMFCIRKMFQPSWAGGNNSQDVPVWMNPLVSTRWARLDCQGGRSF